MALWSLLVFGMRSSPDVDHALPWSKAATAFGFAVWVFFYHFTVVYSNGRRLRFTPLLAYVLLVLNLSLLPTDLLIEGMRLEEYGYATNITMPLGIFMFAVPMFLLVGGAYYNLFRCYQSRPSYEEKNRILYLLTALLFPLVGQLLDGFTNLPPVGIWTNLSFSAICTTALVRYHLLDVRLIIKRSLVYVLVSAAIAIPYVVLVYSLNLVFERVLEKVWIHALIVLLLAVALRPLYSWAQRAVDRFFYRTRYDALRALQQFSHQTQSVANLEELCSDMTQLVSGALRASTVCLLLPNEGDAGFAIVSSTGLERPPSGVVLRGNGRLVKWLKLHGTIVSAEEFDIVPQLQSIAGKEKDHIEHMGGRLYVPIKTQRGQLSAILVVGQKLSQQSYSKEDKELLACISNQMAMALENARLYEEMRESEEKLRLMYESMSEGIVVTDLDANIAWVNEAALRTYGYDTKEELTGRSIFEFIGQEDCARAMENLKRTLRDGYVKNTEYTLLRKDGSRFPAELSATVMRDSRGNPRGFVSIAKDITERKRADEELRQSHEHLRKLSAHLQSVREEERAGIARDMHDELGQTLTGLKMDLSWLSKRLGRGEESLHEKVGRMSQLIGQAIQSVKRMSAELRPGVLDDLGLLAAIEWQVEEFQNRTGIKCRARLESPDTGLDKYLAITIFRIFQEALMNAARHANATTVTVTFKRKDDMLLLKVRDNGRGITAEEISHCRSFGLAGMRERVYSVGGEFNIKGILGKGTTVTASIPVNAERGELHDKNTHRR